MSEIVCPFWESSIGVKKQYKHDPHIRPSCIECSGEFSDQCLLSGSKND